MRHANFSSTQYIFHYLKQKGTEMLHDACTLVSLRILLQLGYKYLCSLSTRPHIDTPLAPRMGRSMAGACLGRSCRGGGRREVQRAHMLVPAGVPHRFAAAWVLGAAAVADVSCGTQRVLLRASRHASSTRKSKTSSHK